MTNHYAAYLHERLGVETIETPQDFVSFLIRGPECFLRDIYVAPEYRRENAAWDLVRTLEKLAVSRGCTILSSTIYPQAVGCTEALHAALHVGFKLWKLEAGAIFLKKEIS